MSTLAVADPAPAGAQLPSKSAIAAAWLLGLLLLGGVVAVALHHGEISEFVRLLREIRPHWILLAVSLQTLSFMCASAVWQVALAYEGQDCRLGAIVRVMLIMLFANQAFPSAGLAGSLVAVRTLGRRRIPAALVVGAIVVGAVTTYAAYAIAVGVSIVLLRSYYAVNLTLLLAGAALAALVVAVPVGTIWFRTSLAPRFRSHVAARHPLASFLDVLASAPVDVLRQAGLWERELLLQFAGIALDSATLFVLLSAVGELPSPIVVFGSFVMASAVGNSVPLPAGVGAFEGSMVMLLRLGGTPIEAALAGTLLFRGLTVWLPMIPGFWYARQELPRRLSGVKRSRGIALVLLLIAAALALASRSPASPDGSLPLSILAYHRFGATVTDSTTVKTTTFRAQLEYLRQHRYRVVPLRTIVDSLAHATPGSSPIAPSVAITVDDGHESVFTDMLPLVREYGIPVTLFVYPSAISNAPYAMTWTQLDELRRTGLFDIQSHTYWHPNFKTEKRRLAADAYERFAIAQLRQPRDVLKQRLGIDATFVAWPFGIYDQELIALARQTGYVAGFSIDRRFVSAHDAVMALPRFVVTNGATGRAFAAMLPPETRGTAPEALVSGRTVDALTRAPVADAIVTAGDTTVRSNSTGAFSVAPGKATVLRVRAQGYARIDVAVSDFNRSREILLRRFVPKALYLSVYGIGSKPLRTAAMQLLESTELNAVVIDMKGDRGIVPYRSAVPLASEIGAQKVLTIDNLPELVASLHRAGVYTIARIVLFKDNLLAGSRPSLAVRRSDGSIFRDREHLAWANPFNRDVWAYNIALAVESARAGFDEIQFDYARLPDAKGLKYDVPWTESNREAAIEGFLSEARGALVPYNVFLAVDVFGYVCWNTDDTRIGQKVERLAGIVDYVSPMLYPSSFQYGIPGYRNPVQHPYEIVRLSLEQARKRTQLSPLHFRPWLQAFRDYAFGGAPFTAGEVRRQIAAAEDFGSAGWMLWNPHNRYSDSDLTVTTEAASDTGSLSGTCSRSRAVPRPSL
jgi:uncharacterized membrane protein YbhN (UPF0104 family)/peptidoglycan/xylan/chitin deacetylase (PgdA/CDA1 family)